MNLPVGGDVPADPARCRNARHYGLGLTASRCGGWPSRFSWRLLWLAPGGRRAGRCDSIPQKCCAGSDGPAPDWHAIVRRCLRETGVEPAAEIGPVEELAQHLEDWFADRLARGDTEETAMQAALRELDTRGSVRRR